MGNKLIFIRAKERLPAAFLTLTKMINERFENQRLRREIVWKWGFWIIKWAKDEQQMSYIFSIHKGG